MWALPNIVAMNEQAATPEAQDEITHQANGAEEMQCLVCSWYGTENVDTPHRIEVFDVFSDDPKEVVALCDKHDAEWGPAPEGYFYCDGCGRTHVQNYTWENYFTVLDGEMFCINCAREAYLADEENWIDLSGGVPGVDFEQVRKAPHLFAVGQDRTGHIGKSGLQFLGNAEFDSMTGQQISGSGVRQILKEAKAAGHDRAIMILDGAYQFAVSIGIYVPLEA